MIIYRSDIETYKPLTQNVPDAEIFRYMEESELMDIRPLLGEEFFADVVANLDEPSYSELLNETEYEYDGKTYRHSGLKRVVVEYAWGRYVFFGNEVSTGWGMVQKQFQDGIHADRNRLKERYKESQKIAAAIWNDVRLYLDRVGTFEKWNKSDGNDLPGRYKMTHVR